MDGYDEDTSIVSWKPGYEVYVQDEEDVNYWLGFVEM